MFNYSLVFSNLGSFAEVITGVLGIAITVVTIIVELAATRYTPKISDLFIRNSVNIVILSFYIITCLFGVWFAVFDTEIHPDFYNQVSNYLQSLEFRVKSEQSSQKKNLLNDEIENTKKIIKNIYEQRLTPTSNG